MNPQWKVIPTIAFMDITKKVLTCKNNYGGYLRMMIHACRWKHHLPSDQPNKIYPVVSQSRTCSKGKASLYSTERKMMEQYGSFGDLDTCNYVELGHFEKLYILIFYNEDKSISDWYNVNNLLDVLYKQNIISSETVNYFRNKAQKLKRENAVDDCSKGATCVPFKAVIYFQEKQQIPDCQFKILGSW